MKAIVVREYGAPEALSVTDYPTPEPGPGEVTIDVAYAEIGLVDSFIATGKFPFPLPLVPGLEVSGYIRSIGPGVTGLIPGQKVAALLVDLSAGGMGGFAEVAVAKAALTIALADEDDLVAAAAWLVNGATAFMATEGLAPGARVAISGASGGLGQSLVLAAKADGASEIIAASRSERRYDTLRTLGATRIVAPFDFAAEGLDAVFDTAGGDIRLRMLNALRNDGHMFILGDASGDDTALPGDTIWRHTLRVTGLATGSLGHAQPDRVVRAARATLAAVRGLPIEAEIVPLAEAGAAHRALIEGSGPGKFVLAVGD
jgi:NADPH2:quinone reductase